MKSLLTYILCSCLILASAVSFSQATSGELIAVKDMGDAKVKQLTADLLAKLPAIKANKVTWVQTEYGYKALYSMGYEDHMTLYDNQSHYRESLKKTVWDNNVAPILKTEFESSEYGLFKVVTYWENISQNTDDYYFELLDPEEQPKNIWADSNGKFSIVPLFMR